MLHPSLTIDYLKKVLQFYLIPPFISTLVSLGSLCYKGLSAAQNYQRKRLCKHFFFLLCMVRREPYLFFLLFLSPFSFPPFPPPSSFHFLLFSFSSFFFSSFSFLPFFPFLLFFFSPFLSFFKLVTIFSLKILQQFHLKENFVKSFSLWKEKISKRYYLKKNNHMYYFKTGGAF